MIVKTLTPVAEKICFKFFRQLGLSLSVLISFWRTPKYRLLITVGLIVVLTGHNATSQTLVWSEEFDGPGIDNTLWNHEVSGDGNGNGELQYYTQRPENSYIENSNLVIQALREDYQGLQFTSARLNTQGKFAFKYGTIEARIKLPNVANGLWPAFWLMGNNYGQVGWPFCGEVDIMEVGDNASLTAGTANSTVGAAVHWWHEDGDWSDWLQADYGTKTTIAENFYDDYHIFGMNWDEQGIQVYVDDQVYFEFSFLDDQGNLNTNLSELYENPAFILVNLAVGGFNFVEITDPGQITAPFPAQMYIDWIRLYDNGSTEIFFASENEYDGNFGVFTETTPVNGSVRFGVDTELYIWNQNNLGTYTETPYEGTGALGFDIVGAEWWGFGIQSSADYNMSRYINGHLHFHCKTTTTQTLEIQISSSATGGSKVYLVDGEEQYGLVRDGEWHEVAIPLNLFANIDFFTINSHFMASMGAPGEDTQIAFDNIYWSESIELPTPENGNFGIFTETTANKDADEFLLDVDGALDIWEGTLVIENDPGPYEGGSALSLTSTGAGWFGMAFRPFIYYNLSAFDNEEAAFHISMKTTSTTSFQIGMKSGSINDVGQIWFNFENGNDPYGFARNGQWHEIVIPASDITTIVDLTQVSLLLQLLGVGEIADLSIDNIYWSGGGEATIPDPGAFPPIAAISASVNGGPAPLNVQFDGSSSYDKNGDALTYQWDFGDGTTASGVSPQHTYTELGTYKATLTVSDGTASNSAIAYIFVNNGYVDTRSDKRGLGYGYHSVADMEALSEGNSWWYNWSPQPDANVADAYTSMGFDFVPMLWNGNFDVNVIRGYIQQHPDIKYILGFNEPNFQNQANMTPAQAAAIWPDVEAIADEFGLQIVSPAVNYCGNCVDIPGTPDDWSPWEWLDAFFAECSGCRVDYIGVHSYMEHPDALKWYLGEYKKYGKPIWLTEFAAWDNFNGDVNDQIDFMVKSVDNMENDPDIFKYAWFTGRFDDVSPFIGILEQDVPGALTDLGETYVNMPVHDASIFYPVPGLIEAENYTSQNGAGIEVTQDETGFLNMSKLVVGDWLEYNINSTAGTYDMTMRVASDSAGGNISVLIDGAAQASLSFGVTGGEQVWTYQTTSITVPSGNHTLRVVVNSGEVNLNWIIIGSGDFNDPPLAEFTADPSAGPAPLTVTFDASASSDPNGDPLTYSWDFGDENTGSGDVVSHTYISEGAFTAVLTVNDGELSAADSVTIVAFNPVDTIMEAEDAILSGTAVRTGHEDYSGTGFVKYAEKVGSYIEWQVPVNIAGPYVAEFRYALQPGDRATILSVNGVVIDENYIFTSTGDWDNWALTEPVTFLLNEGMNTVRLAAIANGGPNVDYLRIETKLDQPNVEPLAFAGEDATLTFPAPDYQLDGSASFDPDGDDITYHWELLSGPELTITNENTASPVISGMVDAVYVFELTVNDGELEGTDQVIITVIDPVIPRLRLEAEDAVLNEAIVESVFAGYSGTGYVEILNDTSSYIEWTFDVEKTGEYDLKIGYSLNVSIKEGQVLINGIMAEEELYFERTGGWDIWWETESVRVFLNKGTNTVQLKATRTNGVKTDYLSVTGDISTFNFEPVANAGADQSVELPTDFATLDGSGSSDPDGDVLTYRWMRISGPNWAHFDDSTAAIMQITNLHEGTYEFSLTVSDGEYEDTDEVIVNVLPDPIVGMNLAYMKPATASSTEGAYTAPNAVDGNSGTRWASEWSVPQWIKVDLGEVYDINDVVLTWEGACAESYYIMVSDVDSEPDPVSTDWKILRNMTGMPDGARTDNVEGLSGCGRYIAIYAYNKTHPWGISLFEFEVYGFHCAGPNNAPIADAGTDQIITLPQNEITLNGTGSTDPDSDPLKYFWDQVSGPSSATFDDDSLSAPTVSGLIAGEYVFALQVFDGQFIGIDQVTVTVEPEIIVGPNLALLKPATASTGVAASAVDGNVGTRWESEFSDPQWIKVDLESTYDISNVIINWEAANATSYYIMISNVDSDPDPVSADWTIISTQTGLPAGARIDQISGLSGCAQYIAVYGTVRGLPYGYSIWELEVYGEPCGETNEAPIADAGADTSIELPVNSADLDGSSSSDPDGDALTYSWVQISGPSVASIGDASAAVTSAGDLIEGTYEFELTVNDGDLSDADTLAVTVLPESTPGINLALLKPATASTGVASSAVDGNIGTRWESEFSDPQWIKIDLEAVYDISEVVINWEAANAVSYYIMISEVDSDPDPASADWTIISTQTGLPAGARIDEISGLSGCGQYIAIYGTERGLPYGYSIWELEVYGDVCGPVNTTPMADAGADVTIELPVNSVDLDGSASSDPDGDALTYSWTRISGPSVATIGDASAAITSAGDLVEGTYEFELTVSDGDLSDADTVEVTVDPEPAPAVNIALNKPATASTGVASAAAAVDGNTGTRWESEFFDPQWIKIDLQSLYDISEVVINWEGANATSYYIMISDVNSDPDPASADWTIISTQTGLDPAARIDDITGLSGCARYIAIYGTVRSLGYGYSIWELEVYGESCGAINLEPVADAGEDAEIVLPVNSVDLDGSASYDPDGDPITFSWIQISGPSAATIGDAGAATTLAGDLVEGTYEFELTVNDGELDCTDIVEVTVLPEGTPTVNLALLKPAAASSGEGAFGAAAAVDGNPGTRWGSEYSDPQWIKVDLQSLYDISHVVINWEGANATSYYIMISDVNSDPDPASVDWTIISTQTGLPPVARIDDITGLSGCARFIAIYGTVRSLGYGYSIWELEVYGVSCGTINLEPIADAGADIEIVLPVNSVDLDGSASFDPDGDAITYSWAQISGPSTATIGDAGAAITSAGDLVEGTYEFELTVNDGESDGTDIVEVTVLPAGTPTVNLALNQPASASSGEGAFEAAAGVDGNPGTRWGSEFSVPQWFMVDLGDSYDIAEVVITWEGANAARYHIMISDIGSEPDTTSADWTIISTQEGMPNMARTDDITGLSGCGRYLAIYATHKEHPWGISFWELEVYGFACTSSAFAFEDREAIKTSDQQYEISGNYLYPNPAGEFINLVNNTDVSRITIVDISGRIKLIEQTDLNAGINTIDISTLNTGTYILILNVGNKQERMYFVKE